MKLLRGLAQKKGRDREGLFIVEGWRSVEEASGNPGGIDMLIYTAEAKQEAQHAPVLLSALKRSREHLQATVKEFEAFADTVSGQGIAAVVKKISPDMDAAIAALVKKEHAFVVALDRIADPGNLGAIIRSADWFGIDAVFLSSGTVDVYSPKVVRSTAGSIFHLPVVDCSDPDNAFERALTALRRGGFTLFGASVHGDGDLRAVEWPKKALLVIGSEARGISAETAALLDAHIAIPRFGKAESLNAGVAAGIFFSHASFQKRS